MFSLTNLAVTRWLGLLAHYTMNDGDVEMDSHNSKALYDVKKVSHISFPSHEIFHPAILGYRSDLNPATIIEDCCHMAAEASVMHTDKKPPNMKKLLRVHFGFLSSGPNSSSISRSHFEAPHNWFLKLWSL